jgi:hypothetical protein
MGAREPKGLVAVAMAIHAVSILSVGCLSGICAEADNSTLAGASHDVVRFLASPHRLSHLGHVVAPGAMAGLTSMLFLLVTGMSKHDLAHHGCAELVGDRLMTTLARFAADVTGGRRGWDRGALLVDRRASVGRQGNARLSAGTTASKQTENDRQGDERSLKGRADRSVRLAIQPLPAHHKLLSDETKDATRYIKS